MDNIFIKQPEFIDYDPRTKRPKISGSKITHELMFKKHISLVPIDLVKDKSILDLGSCIAATGAWVLSNGAKHYKGIEIQDLFINNSRKALSKYYPNSKWEIEKNSIEDFLNTNTDKFDIIIANGIFHSFSDPIKILNKISNKAEIIIIESSHPLSFQKSRFLSNKIKHSLLSSKDYKNYIENEPFIELGLEGMTLESEETLLFNGLRPSFGVIKQIMFQKGFNYDDKTNQELKKKIPSIYSLYKRFGAIFIKKRNKKFEKLGFESALMGNSSNKTYKWEYN